jgi:hypothetical protein
MRLFRLIADVLLFALPLLGCRIFTACVLATYATVHFKYPTAVRWTQRLDKITAYNRKLW